MITFTVGNSETSRAWFRPACQLYDEVFLTHPFEWSPSASEENRAELESLQKVKGFEIVVAHSHDDLVGMIYGHPLSKDHGWWGDFHEPLPARLTEEWDGRTFAVINLAVATSHQRTGLGSQLVNTLLRGREEERAILSVQPAAAQAHRFYEETGWVKIGRKGPLIGVVPPHWDIYLHEISCQI